MYPCARRKSGSETRGLVGFLTTSLTIVLSLIPQPDEPNKPLAVFKVVGGCGALLLIGIWIYLSGKRRARRLQQAIPEPRPGWRAARNEDGRFTDRRMRCCARALRRGADEAPALHRRRGLTCGVEERERRDLHVCF